MREYALEDHTVWLPPSLQGTTRLVIPRPDSPLVGVRIVGQGSPFECTNEAGDVMSVSSALMQSGYHVVPPFGPDFVVPDAIVSQWEAPETLRPYRSSGGGLEALPTKVLQRLISMHPDGDITVLKRVLPAIYMGAVVHPDDVSAETWLRNRTASWRLWPGLTVIRDFDGTVRVLTLQQLRYEFIGVTSDRIMTRFDQPPTV
jgi:hypothetical protein